MRAWARRFEETVQPMVQKEMRSFMRGRRAPLTLFFCTGAVAAIELLELSLLYRAPGLFSGLERLAVVGRQLFFTLTALEAVLVLLIVPLLTAGAISSEHRQGTMEGLLLTRLSGRDIVYGKLIAALGFFAVLLLCLLPVVSVVTLLGGVSPGEVMLVQLLLLATAYCAGAFGVLCSARFPMGGTSYIVAYLVTGAVLTVLFPFTAAIPVVIFWVRNPGERRGCFFFTLGFVVWLPIFLILFPWALAIPLSTSPIIALLALFNEGRLFPGAWWVTALISAGFMILLGRALLAIAADRVRPPHGGLWYIKGAFTQRSNIHWEE